MPVPVGQEFTISGWLMRGAIREDDVLAFDDPYPQIRVLNHFYDPLHNRPLTVLISLGEKAPDWAMGSADIFAQPNTPDPNRDNHYAWFDAREAMYRALTSRSSTNSLAIHPDGTGGSREPVDGQEVAAMRDAYWATTFRSLGDVLHLVEDMAQPQHTRNDAHVTNGHLDKKAYEHYTDARAIGKIFDCANGEKLTPPPLVYGDYPIPTFPRLADYFSTVSGPTPRDMSGATGIADYSNRGFYSAGTNINTSDYPTPAAVSLTEQPIAIQHPCLPSNKQGSISTLFAGVVPDDFQPDYVDTRADASTYDPGAIPLSAKGVFLIPDDTDPTTSPLRERAYTLTEANYIAMADLLIPRAVAYSAGVIDYFFRGHIALARDIDDRDLYRLQNQSAEALNGRFELFYDAVDGFRYPVPDAFWDLQLAAGAESDPLSFTAPVDPAPAAAGRYMLVFRGDLGNETDDAGAVGAVAGRLVCFPLALGTAFKSAFLVDCDGQVFGWGSSESGELIAGLTATTSTPTHLNQLAVKFKALGGAGYGGNHVLAIDVEDTLWAWGANSHGQIGNNNSGDSAAPTSVLNNVRMADVGGLHSLAVTGDGSVWAWGAGGHWQLGYEATEPVIVDGQTFMASKLPRVVPGLSAVTAVAAGASFSLALGGGQIWQWGQIRSDGVLTEPTLVQGLPGGIVQIAAGNHHALALDANGGVWAWGNNTDAQIAQGAGSHADTPVLIDALNDIVKVAAAGWSSYALTRDGTVWAWGDDSLGQLGDGSAAGTNCNYVYICSRYTPAPVTGLPRIIDLVGGSEHVLALAEDGTVWSWGSDQLGQLGQGGALNNPGVPQAVPARVHWP